jgi:hypothetical protein
MAHVDRVAMNAPLPTQSKEDLGQLGPAMKALPNDRWRAFVEFYVLETLTNKHRENYGAQANAARKAGFGKPKTTPRAMAHMAWRLMSDDRMIAAVAEESRKLLRSGAPEAVKAVLNGVCDRDHKDHARFVSMVLDRADPITSHQHVEVIHRTVDPDTEALEELRALRQLGTSREKLIELFGSNGLDRIERLEAADKSRRANEAKVIDGEIVIEAEQVNASDEIAIEVTPDTSRDDF